MSGIAKRPSRTYGRRSSSSSRSSLSKSSVDADSTSVSKSRITLQRLPTAAKVDKPRTFARLARVSRIPQRKAVLSDKNANTSSKAMQHEPKESILLSREGNVSFEVPPLDFHFAPLLSLSKSHADESTPSREGADSLEQPDISTIERKEPQYSFMLDTDGVIRYTAVDDNVDPETDTKDHERLDMGSLLAALPTNSGSGESETADILSDDTYDKPVSAAISLLAVDVDEVDEMPPSKRHAKEVAASPRSTDPSSADSDSLPSVYRRKGRSAGRTRLPIRKQPRPLPSFIAPTRILTRAPTWGSDDSLDPLIIG